MRMWVLLSDRAIGLKTRTPSVGHEKINHGLSLVVRIVEDNAESALDVRFHLNRLGGAR